MRKLHLILSLIAGVFILLGALTGGILAGESVYNQTLPYKSAAFESTTLAQTIAVLKEKNIDALKLSIDRNHFVQVETTEGEKTLYPSAIGGRSSKGIISPRSLYSSSKRYTARSIWAKRDG